MASLTRVLQKIFGTDGASDEFGQVGSDATGSPTTTKDLDTIQSLSQYLLGLYAITNDANEPPRIEDFNSLFYLITSQLSYLFQSGISEWISTENYYADRSIVLYGGSVYIAITGSEGTPNINKQPDTETSDWQLLFDNGGALLVNNNLSDLDSASTSRTNLSVYSKAETDAKYLIKANNLSDVTASTARTNLDVYSKAEAMPKSGGTFTGGVTITSTTGLQLASTTPALRIYDTAGTADQRKIRLSQKLGFARLALFNDAESVETKILWQYNWANEAGLETLVGYRNSAGTESEVMIKTKIIEIGAWNMDADAYVDLFGVPFSELGSASKIMSMSAQIRISTSASSTSLPLDCVDSSLNLQGGITSVSYNASLETLDLSLYRRASGIFDQAGYSSTAFSRGFIVIKYIK
jgi:hypothetical protein